MKKYQFETKWALIFVVVSFLWMFLERSTGLHGKNIEQHATYTNLFATPAIAVYLFALLNKRRNFFGAA